MASNYMSMLSGLFKPVLLKHSTPKKEESYTIQGNSFNIPLQWTSGNVYDSAQKLPPPYAYSSLHFQQMEEWKKEVLADYTAQLKKQLEIQSLLLEQLLLPRKIVKPPCTRREEIVEC